MNTSNKQIIKERNAQNIKIRTDWKNKVLADTDVSWKAKLVMYYLADRPSKYNKTHPGLINPKIETMADTLNTSYSTIRRGIKDLHDAEYLESKRTTNATLYWLVMSPTGITLSDIDDIEDDLTHQTDKVLSPLDLSHSDPTSNVLSPTDVSHSESDRYDEFGETVY